MPASTKAGVLGAEFEALYRAHFAFVWRMLLHFGTPEAVVEDAAQDVFIVVHRRFADWDRSVSARSWLYGIARRVAADHRRSRARHRRKIEALPTPEDPALEQRVQSRERLSSLERALAELDPKLREVFVMAEVEGMSSREIGEALGTNPNTIYSRLRKARAELDRALEGPPVPGSKQQRGPRKQERRHG